MNSALDVAWQKASQDKAAAAQAQQLAAEMRQKVTAAATHLKSATASVPGPSVPAPVSPVCRAYVTDTRTTYVGTRTHMPLTRTHTYVCTSVVGPLAPQPLPNGVPRYHWAVP